MNNNPCIVAAYLSCIASMDMASKDVVCACLCSVCCLHVCHLPVTLVMLQPLPTVKMKQRATQKMMIPSTHQAEAWIEVSQCEERRAASGEGPDKFAVPMHFV